MSSQQPADPGAALSEVKDTSPSVGETSTPTKGKKEPPPEKPSDVRRRSYIILSFWLIVLLLGLPIWWKTTTIYRADLPLQEMLDWSDGKACRPVFPLRISIRAGALQDQEAQNLLRLTQHALDDLNDFSGHHLRLQLASPSTTANHDPDSVLTIRLVPGDATTATFDPHEPILDITYPPNAVPSHTTTSSPLATYVATQLRSAFAEEQATISYLLSTNSIPSDHRPQGLSPDVAQSLSKRTTRSLQYAPTYHLTFSLFTSGSLPSSWDIERAIADYMKPVLDVLSPIHNFTIDTQVQLYATPGVQNQVLNKEDLSSFINAAEWPLSPSIGGAPTINFVIFIGNQTIAAPEPGADSSRSWLIPQWGAVYLLPLPADTKHVSASVLKQPLLTFTSHLLALTGAPTSGSLPLRLSTLGRIRSADLLLRASSTLGSLARLALALPSISIPPRVADGVATTIQHLRLACDSLGTPDGLRHARVAEAEAERAFFEKSMVGQLYFPDEHKVAVYLPLLGPVAVPLIIGLVNELKAWVKRKREKSAVGREKKSE
ncbi:hypothetical protein VTJ04DRAFT_10574 [Mycothermus thermophilus]|uniref:uncharacterized protein n=1 Tax=Humicola insolens TaxID=85995 RepID=UPI003744A3FC